MDLGPKKVVFFGLTFKENTDDPLESPTTALLEHLIAKGREIRIYDPTSALTVCKRVTSSSCSSTFLTLESCFIKRSTRNS